MIELTDGLQTMVGERGIKLSGGQRQRIALARALARKPEILILDEATSNLDTDSESKIQSAINNLRGKITILFITHRISSITSADQIIVIKNSKVEEIGTPEILMNNPNSYFSKISNQNF
jgi:ATP-binding cassette subfamily C protein